MHSSSWGATMLGAKFFVNSTESLAFGANPYLLDNQPARVVQLPRPPQAVLFRPHRPNGVQLPGLRPGVIPSAPWSTPQGFGIIVLAHKPGTRFAHLMVTRCQLPLLRAYAMTFCKAHRRTIRYKILDVLSPKGSSVTTGQIYVGKSRSLGQTQFVFSSVCTNRMRAKL
ncbi:hypothetical protein DL93DRAFT_1104862 [Clavulina sp. PMI_390]|nr:hypothetical protein DL93DRAFT_1104862 [Clavulina sp. PMI_390]